MRNPTDPSEIVAVTAADAIVLAAAGKGGQFFMTTTPIERIDAARAARARRYVDHVRAGETLADVAAVAARIRPLIHAELGIRVSS